jgi:hypothetical protein
VNREALEIAVRAIVREILVTPESWDSPGGVSAPQGPWSQYPQPRVDFVPESDDPLEDARQAMSEMEPPPDLFGEPIETAAQARARRIREARERDFPENLPMRGMTPPDDDG